MKRLYSSPEFELHKFKISDILLGEVVVSDPQIPDDDINPGELD